MAFIAAQVWIVVAVTVLAVGAGAWVFYDARRRGREELAPFLGGAVGLVFLAGSIPAFVALVVAADATVQGFPTALRVVPGFAAVGAYILLRDGPAT